MSSHMSAVAARRAKEAAKKQDQATLQGSPNASDSPSIKQRPRKRKKKSLDRIISKEEAISSIGEGHITHSNHQLPETPNHSPPNISESEGSESSKAPQSTDMNGRSDVGGLQLQLLGRPRRASSSSSRDQDAARLSVRKEPLCTFQLQDLDNSADLDLRIKLSVKDTLVLVGQYDLWIRQGAVTVSGAVIHASSKLHRVYAPSTHALPLMKALPNPFGPQNTATELTIQSCYSRIRSLKDVSSNFKRIWNSNGKKTRSFDVVRHQSDDPYQRPLWPLEISQEWERTISSIVSLSETTAPIFFIIGPKNSGKSTFARLLTNAVLTRQGVQTQSNEPSPTVHKSVAILDIDPGQPEYSPPGVLSLVCLTSSIVGPSFTHPEILPDLSNRVIKRHFYGYLSPREDTHHYLECILDLFSSYISLLQDTPGCPLIINSSGWVQGEGTDLIMELIEALKIRHTIFVSKSGVEDVPPKLSKAATASATKLYSLKSQALGNYTTAASDLRSMQTQSYFHLADPEGENLRWNPSPLVHQKPLVVQYSGPKQSILGVAVLGDEISPQVLDSVLDGCIVGVVVIAHAEVVAPSSHEVPQEGDNMRSEQTHEQTSPSTSNPLIVRSPSNIPYLSINGPSSRLLSPKGSSCLGQAIIRSKCPVTQSLHLLTPIPAADLQTVLREKRQIVLVRGKLDTPAWLYEEKLEYDKAMQRRREKAAGAVEERDETAQDDDLRIQVEKTPWVEMMEGEEKKGKSKGSKKRSGRRNLKFRGMA